MDYLELILHFEKSDGNLYRVNAISTGRYEHSDTEFSGEFIASHTRRLSEVERGSLDTSASYQALQTLGQELFEKVFFGKVKELLKQCQQEVFDKKTELRIVIDLPQEAAKLSALGWEYLYDPEYEFLVTWRKFSVAHCTTGIKRDPIRVNLPLHILAVISNPPWSIYPQIDSEKEWANLEESLASLRNNKIVRLERVCARAKELSKYLSSSPEVNILHFIGHGKPGVLIFEKEDGWDDEINGDKLADLLKNQNDLGLVFLNSCSGAKADEYDMFSGTAQALLSKGIPAVIAMRTSISDTSAKILSQSFYGSLAAGLSVDAALSDARVQVRMRTHENEWGIAKLFIQDPGGGVFDLNNAVSLIKGEWAKRWRGYRSEKASGQNQQDGLFELISVLFRYEQAVTLAKNPDLAQSARKQFPKLEPDLWVSFSGLVRGKSYEKANYLLDVIDHWMEAAEVRALVFRSKKFLKGVLSAEESVDTAVKLWGKFGEKVRSLCVTMLLSAIEQGGETIVQGVDLPRDLLLDQELRKNSDIGKVIAISTNYQLPSPAGKVIKERKDLDRWLKAVGFNHNPFGQREIEKDRLLISTWVQPKRWEDVTSHQSHLVISECRQDRIAAALMLAQDIFTHQKKIFPVKIVLPVENSNVPDQRLRILEGVADAVAETWIEFLKLNLIAFWDLLEDVQRKLMALLLWYAKGRQNLLSKFGEQHPKPEAWKVFYNTMTDVAKGPTIDFHEDLDDWLALRPVNTTSTFFIADCQRCVQDDHGVEQIGIFIQYMQSLKDKEIYVKLFSDKDLVCLGKEQLTRIDLRWSSDALSKMLSDRIYQASRRYNTLNEMFGRNASSQTDKHNRLVQESDGSLSKMLDLGNELLDLHLRNHPGETDFWPDDFEQVLSRY